MPALDRNVKVTCGNCGISVMKRKKSWHKKRCSGATLYCPKCPNISTKVRYDVKYHIAKKPCVPRPAKTHKCKKCHAEFPGFFALRQRKKTQHGTQIGFRASNFDVEDIVGDVGDQTLREKLESCEHFLTDTEMENGRRRVFNFAMSSFDMSLLNNKLDNVFKELKGVAKVDLAIGFALKNIEDGICRCFYAHENNTIMERAKLVCTKAGMTNLIDRMLKKDNVDFFTRERAIAKWNFYKYTTLTIFASLFKDVPMGCKDTFLPEKLLRKCNMNCFTFVR